MVLSCRCSREKQSRVLIFDHYAKKQKLFSRTSELSKITDIHNIFIDFTTNLHNIPSFLIIGSAINNINQNEFPLQLGEMIRSNTIRISFNYHINFTHFQKLFQTMLILQMPKLIESSQIIESYDTFLVSLFILF